MLRKFIGVTDPDWESKLPKQLALELSAARARASVAMSTLLEQNIISYELVPVKPSAVGGSGVPQYPNEIMQGGEFKGQRRDWRVAFMEPKEGAVKGKDGKVLRGDDFKEFLKTHNGMTSPDGTTIVWGEVFKREPHKLAIVLRHELAHYELFANAKWAEEKTWAEREVEAYGRSKAAIKGMGLPLAVQAIAEAEEMGNLVQHEAYVTTEKSISEMRPWYMQAYDKGRAMLGLKPRIEDPGYNLTAGYHMDPEAWQRIRDDGNILRGAITRQRAARALISVAEDVCRDPASAHDPALRQRYHAIPYDAGEVPIISDDCTAEIAKYLFGIKGRGSDEFWASGFESIARGHQAPKPELRPKSIVVTAFHYAAEKICADPVGYPRSAEFRDWFRTERRFDSSPESSLPYGCVRSVFNHLWKAQRNGETEVDPDELSRVSERGRADGIVFPAAQTPPPTTGGPAPPPSPPPPPISGPSPREPKAPPLPYPPCLHDRCATRN